MTVFLCIDDRGGMIFNNRRQSRDRALIDDVIDSSDGGILYVSDFSEDLFSTSGTSVICVPDPLYAASDKAFVFLEVPPILPYANKIDRLVIYKWNRSYPFDRALDVSPEEIGLTLSEVGEFVGTSHEKITKEVYTR